MIKKSSFYSQVAFRKVFALLLCGGVAFCLLFLAFYLLEVYVPELEAPITDFSPQEMRDHVVGSKWIIRIIASVLYIMAFGLLCVATGIMLYWTEEDYFDEKTSRKYAAFTKNVR